MSDAETKSIRPIAITLLCLFMVFGGVVAAATFLTPAYEQFPVWYQYSVAVNTALGFVIVFGLWKMRRWALMLYALGTIVGQAVTIVLGEWMVSALIYPLIALVIMAGYYRGMD